jgi:hypothetical protein
MSDDADREHASDDPGEAADAEPAPNLVAVAAHRGPMFGPFGMRDAGRRCLFCQRGEGAVAKLVSARGAYICDRCVRIAVEAINDSSNTGKIVRIKPPRFEPGNRAEAEDAIERAYEIVLASTLSDSERAAAIESGDNLLPTMQEVQRRYPMRTQLDVVIDYVRFLDEDEAEVGFALLLPGPTPVPGMQIPSKGYAVRQDGIWKMARGTYAELVGRLGITIPPAE